MIPHMPAKMLTVGRVAKGALHDVDQPRADLLGLMLGGRLDHHPYQRLGPGRPDEDATTPVQRLVLPLDRARDLWVVHRPSERGTVGGANVDEALRELHHRVALL